MAKLKKLLLCVLILIVIVVGAFAAHGILAPKPAKTGALTPTPPKAQPKVQTERIILPTGQQETVLAHQLTARITDQNTVQSFGSNIRKIDDSGVYVITVPGDLVQAEAAIKQKPGVVWVIFNAVSTP